MDKIALIKSLIEKTDDEKELKALHEQLIEAIREQEAEKIEKKLREEMEKKQAEEKKKADEKALEDKKKASTGFGSIQVTSAGLYKGLSIEKAKDFAMRKFAESPSLKAVIPIAQARPEQFEGLIKVFADLYANAIESPITKAEMAGGSDSTGGYLVPEEQRMELLSYIREASIALQDCTVINMTSDVMTLPRELTKVSVAFTGEGNAATEAEPTFDQVTLTASRMDGYSVSSNELLQDTGVPGGIVGVLLAQFTEAIGQKVDSAVFMGTGSPCSSVFSSAGYSQVFSSGSTNFSAILESDLRGIISKIPSSRLGNAKWYVHRSPAWTYLYGMKDSDGRLLFIPSMVMANPHQLYGYPVRMPEQAPSVSAAGKGFIVFGDLRGFWIGERLANVGLFVDPYSKSTKYQTMFLMFTRWAFAHALPGYYGRIVTAAT